MAERDWLRSVRKVAAVARHELIGTVTRAGYLVTLVGMPLFLAAFSGLSGLLTTRVLFEQLGEARAVGFIDESGLFANAAPSVVFETDAESGMQLRQHGAPPPPPKKVEVRRFGSFDEGRRAVREGGIDLLLRIPPQYLTTGRVEEFRKARSGLDFATGSLSARGLSGWFTSALVAGRLDPQFAARVQRPVAADSFVIEADGSVAKEDLLRELRPMLLPLGFSLLLLLSIFTSASYLATGLAEEKQNRALEMLLTSLTAEQLFWGKLFGLWLAALAQFLLYLMFIGAPAAFAFAALDLHAGQALAGFAYFVLGFFFYGAALLAVGSIGDTQKYTQQLSSAFTFIAVLPLTLLPVILGRPQGALARVLTYVPFTAPIAGMLRSGAGALPPWELLLSLLSLALGAILMVRGCAKIFRIALLSAGGRPGPARIWAWLRE